MTSPPPPGDRPVDPGRIGLWTGFLDRLPTSEMQERVAEIDERGWGALWLPEAVGREPFVSSTLALSASSRLVLATGIASIYARDAMAMAAGHRTITEAFPDRFLLGMGVSHQPMVEGSAATTTRARSRPCAPISTPWTAPCTSACRRRHEPRAGARRARTRRCSPSPPSAPMGAHPYFVPVEHTAVARARSGRRTAPLRRAGRGARDRSGQGPEIARTHMAIYLTLPNYTNNLRRYGFGDDDFADGGSDRLVDAIVAWGDVDAVGRRVRAHHDAGADHVCVQVVTSDYSPGVEQWRRLADALALLTSGGDVQIVKPVSTIVATGSASPGRAK